MEEIIIPRDEQGKPKRKPTPSKPLRERREKGFPGTKLPYPHQGPPKGKPKPGKPD